MKNPYLVFCFLILYFFIYSQMIIAQDNYQKKNYRSFYSKGEELIKADKLGLAREYFDSTLKYCSAPYQLKHYANLLCKKYMLCDVADKFYQKVLELFPDSQYHLEDYASFLIYTKRDYDAAEAVLMKALSIDKSNKRNLNNYAFLLWEVERYDEAEPIFQILTSDIYSCRDIIALRNYGRFLHKIRKDYYKAEEYLLKAFSIRPNSSHILFNMASLMEDMGKYDDAEKYHRRNVLNNPRDAYTLANFADFLHFFFGYSEEVLNLYKRFYDLDVHYLYGYLKYAELLKQNNQPFDFIARKFEEIDNVAHANFLELNNYIVFLTDIQCDTLKADSVYQKILDKYDNHPGWLQRYANFCSIVSGDIAKANEYFLKALSIGTNSGLLFSDYAVFLDLKLKNTKAREYHEKATIYDSLNTHISIRYALCLYEHGDKAKAQSLILEAINREPDNSINLNICTKILLPDSNNIPIVNKILLNSLSKINPIPENLILYSKFLIENVRDTLAALARLNEATKTLPRKIDSYISLAEYYRNIKKDLDSASSVYHRGFKYFPNNSIMLGNLSQILCCMEQFDKAEIFIDSTFSHLNSSEGLKAEMWFYRYAHFEKWREQAEAELDRLIGAGADSPGWNFDQNIKIAIKNGHPNPEKLKRYSKLISETDK